MKILYTDNDPFACAWLDELILARLIPWGDVLCRDIQQIKAHELERYTQIHFFCGIGGWPYAIELAGWGDRPVWTGSCPCQPLSCAGKQKGHADKRHLWPSFYELIHQCEPATVFGEQVAGKDGREWFSGVRADLEGIGYACGAADLSAASQGAPHIRQRLFWVADSGCAGDECERRPGKTHGSAKDAQGKAQERQRSWADSGHSITADGVADAQYQRYGQERNGAGRIGEAVGDVGLGDAAEPGFQRGQPELQQSGQAEGRLPAGPGHAGGMVHATLPEAERQSVQQIDVPRTANWRDSKWHLCRDGKYRRIPLEPAIFPLAERLPNRVGLLRGAGNAIVPQVGAAFVQAFLETEARQ